MRKVRGYLIGGAAGAMLMLGGQAVASIPDATDDRIYACYFDSASANKNVQLLDRQEGTGACPAGWTQISWDDD